MGKSPLSRLREIRDEEHRVAELRLERDELIREAVGLGYTEGQIAKAIGKSPARISQILHKSLNTLNRALP